MKKSLFVLFTLFLFMIFPLSLQAALVAEYRMDECIWDGTANEVLDTIGSYHGESVSATIDTDGKINHCGNLNNQSYIQFTTNKLTLGSSWSMSFWLHLPLDPENHTLVGTQFVYVFGSVSGTGDLGYIMHKNSSSDLKWGVYSNSRSDRSTNFPDNLTGWNHITLVKNGSYTYLYVNGNYYNRVNAVTTGSVEVIGTSTDDDTGQTIGSKMDEIKFFNTALSDTEISNIYNYENSNNNYDNTPRSTAGCNDPITPTCSTPSAGLLFSTYDTTGSGSYPADETEYQTLIDTYQTIDKWFGSGVANTINGSDNPYGSNENYLSIFEGYINVPTDGIYTFAVDGDDAIEVKVANEVVTGYYGGHGACSCQTYNGSIYLKSGYHKLEFHHQNYTGSGSYYLYWKRPEDSSYTIVPNTNLFHCSMNPTVDYRFDSCLWNGTTREVKDHSGNDFNTSANNLNTTNNFSIVNNSADFTVSSITDYISIDNTILHNIQDFSIATWIKTTNSAKQSILSGANSGQNNELIFWLGGTKFSTYIKGSSKNITIPNIADDVWHHLVWTREGTNNCIYIDGTQEGTCVDMTDQALDIDLNGLIIGQEQDAVGGRFNASQDYDGYLDEFKIFQQRLTTSQIHAIFNRENSMKNYDDSHRIKIDCTPPSLLAEYRFDECKYSGNPNEIIDTIGGDNSGTITGTTANITKDEKVIGHALHLNGGAIDVNGLAVSMDKYRKHTVMFWMYWNGTNSIMPFGWNLHDLWITGGDFGFNTSNGDIYGISNIGLANGWHHIAAVFTNEDVYSNRIYIDGVQKTLSQLRSSPNNTRAVVNVNARIGGWRANTGYRFKSYLDEFKIYKGEIGTSEITTIYANELAGKNYDGTIRNTPLCGQAIFNAVNQNGGCFNWDNNITTKISGDAINFTVLSKDKETNATITDANITQLDLLSFSDATCSTLYTTTQIWNGNSALDSNGCFNPTSFIHDKAVRCAKVKITGIYENETLESNSSDTFSIRPQTFILENIPTGKLTAEHNYTFQAKAVNSNGSTQTINFNTLVTLQSQKYFRDDSDGSALDGTFTPSVDFNFIDGITANTNLSFNNVGKIGLELNDTLWTIVDSDDTSLEDRTIYLEQNLTFIPDRFDIAFDATPTMTNDNDKTFTYYADDETQMGAELKNLSFKITALGEDGGVMTNYQNPQIQYFANNIEFTLGLSVTPTPNITADINESQTKDLNFNTGVATLPYANRKFNFGREYNVTKVPIIVDGSNSDINITATDHVDIDVKGAKLETFDGNATFYYGKVATEDIKTSEDLVSSKTLVALYSPTPLSGFEQVTSNWYINKEDDFSTITLTPKTQRTIASVNNTFTSATNIMTSNSGNIAYDLTNTHDSSYKAFYHLTIPDWLWYNRYGDYDGATDCSTHPCFEYIFESENDTIGISSGDFNGTNFQNDFNSKLKKKAIKLMR